jgi:response regulator RpfG family c-di-GMP phosphodiesterase
MVFEQPNQPSLGIEQALENIRQNRGILYNTEVVDACVKLFAEKGFKFE